ncbi:hypothetical protein ACWGJ2_02680 [Streptomyces sp. NPDC054796]
MSGAEVRVAPGSRLLLTVERIEVFRARNQTGDGNNSNDSNGDHSRDSDTRPDTPGHVEGSRTVERAPYASW